MAAVCLACGANMRHIGVVGPSRAYHLVRAGHGMQAAAAGATAVACGVWALVSELC